MIFLKGFLQKQPQKSSVLLHPQITKQRNTALLVILCETFIIAKSTNLYEVTVDNSSSLLSSSSLVMRRSPSAVSNNRTNEEAIYAAHPVINRFYRRTLQSNPVVTTKKIDRFNRVLNCEYVNWYDMYFFEWTGCHIDNLHIVVLIY